MPRKIIRQEQDHYCALCSGPVSPRRVLFGSKKEKALRRRQKRVDNTKKRLAGKDLRHEDSKEWKEQDELGFSRARKVEDKGVGMSNTACKKDAGNEKQENDGVADDDQETDDNDDSADDHWKLLTTTPKVRIEIDAYMEKGARWFDACEQLSYDPDKLSPEDAQWIDHCAVLGINAEIGGAFISARGWLAENACFCVQPVRGPWPRDRLMRKHYVYNYWEPDDMDYTFPLHEECFELLTKRLDYESGKEINKEMLHEVMRQNMGHMARNLELDYGEIAGAEQFWECHPGHEWSVTDPSLKPGIEELVKSMLPAQLFNPHQNPCLELFHKVRHDPLAALPYDIFHGIFPILSLKDTKSLINASHHVFDITREPAFWRHMIRLHIVPFFWELDILLNHTTFPETFEWKGAFQWLDKITMPTFGMEGPMMAIVNRRRIWNVCGQLAPSYHKKIYGEAYKEPNDAEAAAIMREVLPYQVGSLFWPQFLTYSTQVRTTQFIRSWSEIGHRACDLDTYWVRYGGELLGLSVNFGSVKRLFGSTSDSTSRNGQGMKGLSLHIKAEEWIKEIQFSYDFRGSKHVRKDWGNVERMRIDGMRIRLTSGVERYLKSTNDKRARKTFAALPGMHIVGLTGEVDTNGHLFPFDILQAPLPPHVIVPKYVSPRPKFPV